MNADRIAAVLRDELERHGLDDMGFDDQHVAEHILRALADEEEQLDWNVIDDPMFYKSLFMRWKSEVRFQQSKVNVLKERLEDVRELLRQLEQCDWQDLEKRKQLHQLVFN